MNKICHRGLYENSLPFVFCTSDNSSSFNKRTAIATKLLSLVLRYAAMLQIQHMEYLYQHLARSFFLFFMLKLLGQKEPKLQF
jgi:hypothetical protein